MGRRFPQVLDASDYSVCAAYSTDRRDLDDARQVAVDAGAPVCLVSPERGGRPLHTSLEESGWCRSQWPAMRSPHEASTSVLSYPCPEAGAEALGRTQEARVEGGELGDLVHQAWRLLGHEAARRRWRKRRPQGGRGPRRRMQTVTAQGPRRRRRCARLGVHLVELAGVVDLVSQMLRVAVDLLGAVARS